MERFEGGELLLTELVDALGSQEVLEPMLAEVAHAVVPDQRCGRRRDERLSAVPRCGDPGRPVNVGSDIALVGDERRPRVYPDPNPDRP